MNEERRILVVDDHAIVRAGVKQLISASGRYHVGEASTASEAINFLRNQHWDLVLLDISLRERNGLEVIAELRSVQPNLPILVLTMHSAERYAANAIRLGANGYIEKDAIPSELIDAITAILSGKHYISGSSAESPSLAKSLLHETLSEREAQVFHALCHGATLGSIADKYGLSVRTIEHYRSRVLEKMGMRDNAELIRYAVRNDLVK